MCFASICKYRIIVQYQVHMPYINSRQTKDSYIVIFFTLLIAIVWEKEQYDTKSPFALGST
jgi:hypothetical protein